MKNQILIKTVFLLLLFGKSFGQNNSIGSFNYNINTKGSIINCVLYFNDFSAISYNQNVISNLESTNTNIQNVYQPTTLTANYQYKNQKSNILLSAQRGNKVVKEELRTIDWKISKEKKVILGYNCIKATGTLRGRTYDAWFCPKISSNLGPWKFYGLPGLILEAKSTDNEVDIEPVKINLNDKSHLIEIPKLAKNQKVMSYKEYSNNYHATNTKMAKPQTRKVGDGFIVIKSTPPTRGLEIFPAN